MNLYIYIFQVKKIKSEPIIEEEEYEDDDDYEDEDQDLSELDESGDPDWTKTPRGKRTTNSMNSSSNKSSIGVKRASNDLSHHTCKCKTGCKTKRCKCKGADEFCSDVCGCGKACENRDLSPKKSRTSDNSFNKENDCSINVDQAFLTPSFPKNIQRKTFYNN